MQRLSSVKAKAVSLGHWKQYLGLAQYYVMTWPRIQQNSECQSLGEGWDLRVKDLTRTTRDGKSVSHLYHSLETGAYTADPSGSPVVL